MNKVAKKFPRMSGVAIGEAAECISDADEEDGRVQCDAEFVRNSSETDAAYNLGYKIDKAADIFIRRFHGKMMMIQ
ncbi:hypothetical protein KSP39_PZI016356 [Platanthera zijinensis]|uniref:Uncharacterized protein n=1 Tax=Platanthera zijinensis TaxID=2320716 RepID=A0AAP0G0S8_9ASPA